MKTDKVGKNIKVTKFNCNIISKTSKKLFVESFINNIMFFKRAKKQVITEQEGKIMAEKEVNPDENTIYVGNKPPMSYVLAVVTQFNGGSQEVIIKARGRAISRAVDTAEITRNRFVTNAKVKDIKIGTESITNEEGRNSNVSSIEISLTTKK
jgi:DNA-binding protein